MIKSHPIWLIFCGLTMGVANSIPGLSGGTMAVILGIYTSLVTAATEIKHNTKRSLMFILPVCIGIPIGIFGFTYLITLALEHYFMISHFFFIGLILGSIPMILNKTLAKGYNHHMILPFLVGLGLVIISLFITPTESFELITQVDVDSLSILLLSGALSSFAMIVPGVSGSFILLLLGTFSSINMAIISFNLPVLLVFCIGSLSGLVVGTKTIAYLLSHHYQATYSSILGLVIGSIFVIYPGLTADIQGFFSIIFCLFGILITLCFSKKIT